LDEPSNHLSLDAIEALIGALQDYTGGIMLISHNAHLVSHVCRELWMVKGDGTVSVRRPAIEHLGTNKKTEGGDSDSDGYDEKVQVAMDELLQRCIQEQMEG
jgi:ATPase subunit of ABC transporter with duplicated ATPase domains